MQLIPLLINFTSFAQLQIKDKLRTFPRREGFTRNKRKSSALICLIPFLTLSQPSPPGARLRPAYGPENQDSVHRSLIMTSHVVAEGFDLPQRGRMPLTLPWKGRCPTLNSDVGRMSCISSAARLVLWFFRKCIF